MHRHAALITQLLMLVVLLFVMTPLVRGQSEDDILYVIPDEDGDGYYVQVMDVASGTITRLDHIRDLGSDSAWSPDGQFVYMVGDADEDTRFLKLFDVEAGSQQIVTNQLVPNECANSVSWSPDGRFLVYFTGKEAQPSIQILDTDSARSDSLIYPVDIYIIPYWSPDSRFLSPDTAPLAEHPDATILWDVFSDEVIATLDDERFGHLSWSPNSEYMAFIPENAPQEVAVLTFATGEVKRYTGDRIGQWSSDSRYLIHFREAENNQFQVFILDTAEDEVFQLGEEGMTARYHGWSPDARYVAYETEEGVTRSLHVLDLSIGTSSTIISGTPYFSRVTWSPSGHVLAFSSGKTTKGDTDTLTTVDLDAGTSREFEVFTFGSGYNEPLRWSPDGRFFMLSSDQGISVYDHKTGQLHAVTESLGYLLSPRWSADGRYLSVYSFAEVNPDIYVIDTANDLKLLNVTNTPEETEIFLGWRGTGQNGSLIHCGIG